MSHLNGMIIIFVITGLAATVFSGYRLNGAVRLISALVIIVAVMGPVISLIDVAEPGLLDELIKADATETSGVFDIYVDECKRSIERALDESLAERYGDCGFCVCISVDGTDPANVLISSVDVRAEKNVGLTQGEIINFIKECTGCRNINVEFTEIGDG